MRAERKKIRGGNQPVRTRTKKEGNSTDWPPTTDTRAASQAGVLYGLHGGGLGSDSPPLTIYIVQLFIPLRYIDKLQHIPERNHQEL